MVAPRLLFHVPHCVGFVSNASPAVRYASAPLGLQPRAEPRRVVFSGEWYDSPIDYSDLRVRETVPRSHDQQIAQTCRSQAHTALL